ncbi:MAG TPA: hypothetical protein VFL54_11670, partial [Gammaproteobacteria bacterium]|nr:hypothetical protein [Gammaproteobacteria bacterium]
LETPHRWIRAGNEPLGRWLLSTRPQFRENREPDYRGGPIDRRTISYRELARELIRFTHQRDGRICVIGPKARPLPASLETTLVKQKYRVLEPNELSVLRDLIVALCDGSASEQAGAAFNFLTRAYGGLPGDDKNFLEKILKGQAQRPQREDRRALCIRHTGGATAQLLHDLLHYIERMHNSSCKLHESVSALKCILEAHLQSGADLSSLYAGEIANRKYQSRSHIYRCTGSTLLVKGLEFDHAIVLRSPNWQTSWGSYRDLYVALTRGSRSTTLVDLTR